MKAESECEHVSSEHFDKLSLQSAVTATSEPDACSCSRCGFTASNLWRCLHTRCTFTGCGEKQQDCSTRHFEERRHGLVFNIATSRIWCYLCEREVKLNESVCMGRGAVRRSEPHGCGQHKAVAGHSHGGSGRNVRPLFAEVEGGARCGLRNLGNTCYLNAALQALSHCTPFSRYFVDLYRLVEQDPAVTEGVPGRSRRLALALADLLREMVRPGAPVAPHMFVREFQLAFNAFRVGSQQDAQEFLRCLLDRVHEELKLPLGSVSSTCLAPCADRHSESADQPEGDKDSELADLKSECPTLADDADSAYATGTSTLTSRNGDQQSSSSASEPVTTATSRTKPRTGTTYRSVVSDAFEGKLLSSVKCRECGHVSTMVESFMDLSLPIPMYSVAARRRGMAAKAQEEAQKKTDEDVQLPEETCGKEDVAKRAEQSADRRRLLSTIASVFSLTRLLRSTFRAAVWFYSWCSWFKGLFLSTPVTLQDCLDAYFRTDVLDDENRYSCKHCRTLRNGLKYAHVLRLPEVLCIHLKRFRHDFAQSTKLHNYVEFPLDGLEMRQYLHPDCRDSVSSYDLVAAVVHHGGAGGGHYTAYALNMCDGEWYEFDDSSVERVDSFAVQQAGAYILFYKKKDDAMVAVRDELGRLLDNQNRQGEANGTLMRFYVASEWLHKLAYFAEPGPPDNSYFVCHHGAVHPRRCSPRLPIYDRVVPVSPAIWSFLRSRLAPSIDLEAVSPDSDVSVPGLRKRAAASPSPSALLGDALSAVVARSPGRLACYGNSCAYGSLVGPAVTHLSVCEQCEQTERRLAERRSREQREFTAMFEQLPLALANPAETTYAVSTAWMQSWEQFVCGKSEVPGAIDNWAIAVRLPRSTGGRTDAIYVLNPNGNYCEVSEEIWRFFHERYAGGPQLVVRKARALSQRITGLSLTQDKADENADADDEQRRS